MKVSVAIVTYRRAWALPYSLQSVANQKRTPDEVVVVLKPSGDKSEEIIESFKGSLNIRLVIQERGNFTDAVSMAIRHSTGDIVLFLDDDAIAHEEWVTRYIDVFRKYKDMGGASGLVYKALLKDGSLVKTNEVFYPPVPTKPLPHRKPLAEYSEYCAWISQSGFMGRKQCNNGIYRSALLGGVNMGLRRELVYDCPLAELYKKSRRGLWNESLLAYCIRRKGFHTYFIQDPGLSPTVWHIAHPQSLTRTPGFWSEFWIHYDRVVMYKRLKALGARVSPWRYALALALSLRKRPLPRLFATIYALVVGY